MDMEEHTSSVQDMMRKVGVPDSKATAAYWRSLSVVATHGPYALSHGLLASRAADSKYASERMKAQNQLTERAEERKVRIAARNAKIKARKERQKKNATPADKWQ
jgi:hypothetical protein